MELRREPRLPQSEMVRIFGLDTLGKPINISAYTLDISHHGARLRNVNCWEQPGETIGVRRGLEKARFKVVWVGRRGTPVEGQVGLTCVDHGKFIWAIAPPEAKPVAPPQMHEQRPHAGAIALAPLMVGGNNRRKHNRYRCEGGVKVTEAGATFAQWTQLHDVSAGGCYVETTTPLLPTTRIEAVMHVGDVEIRARGHVTVSHRLVGMGLQFTEMSPLNRERLEHVVQTLAQANAAGA